jgi:LAO/AO transport system kinase
VVELADMLAINKADGDNIPRATAAAAEYRAALHIVGSRSPHWAPPVTTYSALTGDGVAQLWATVLDHRARMTQAGEHAARRREQQVKWMRTMLEDRVLSRLTSDPALRAKLFKLEAAVADGRLSPAVAVEEIAETLGL